MTKASLRVCCVQLNAYPLERAEEGLTHALDMIDRAARDNPDLVVLPECVYPAYYLSSWPSRRPHLRPTAEVLALFSDKAKEHGFYLAVGVAEESADGRAYNAGFLFDAQGRPAGMARKQFLWHFDSRWFTPGNEGDTIETPWGRIGMFICADGRVPEIPRALALKGARLLIDLTNLVATGKDETRLTSPQVEYMLKCRAIENQGWVVMANKVGTEADSVVYCGRSLVVSPQGDVVAQGCAHLPELVTADIPLPFDRPAPVDGVFAPTQDRRPETYGDLVRPLEELQLARIMGESVVPEEMVPVVATLQLDMGQAAPDLALKLERYLSDLAVQGVDIVVLPEPAVPSWLVVHDEPVVRVVEKATAQRGIAVVLTGDEVDGGRRYRTAFFIEGGRVVASYRKLHLDANERGRYTAGHGDYCVVRGRRGNFGIMLGYEGFLPEVARILTLRGADVIVWPCCLGTDRHELFARTRAAENRVFVAAANAVGRHGAGGSLIASPAGAVLAQAFTDREQAVSAMLPTVDARCKAIVPGTDAIRGREPGSYRLLIEEPGA